jgi:serine phosphatase RsbU (regulator of sigma subunit)
MAKEAGDKKSMSSCYNGLGIIHYYQGDYDKAVFQYLNAIKIFHELNDNSGMSAAYSNIGLVYAGQGLYDKALENYQNALKILEKMGDEKGIASCYNNIGLLQYDQKSYETALDYFFKSLKINEKIANQTQLASNFNNIGNVYSDQSKYDEAIAYYKKSLKIREDTQDKISMSGCYNNIGLIYFYKGELSRSLEYYNKTLAISLELGDKSGIAKVYGNLSSLYLELSEKGGNNTAELLKKALECGQKSYDLAVEIGAIPVQNTTAAHLKKAYTKLGLYKEAIYYANIYISTKDSMFSDEKTNALAEMGAKYQSEKKQLEIDNLSNANKLKALELSKSEEQRAKQKIILYSFIFGFILILTFSILILRLFVQKKKANILLAKQKEQIELKNNLLEQANEEINAQKDEIQAQRDMVIGQKEFIEGQQKEIIDSINYAKKIQQAVIPVNKESREILGKHFILFRPRDVVSGDFYWATRIEHNLVVAVADCTGHGVPGAFMSMLGISSLNEIVRRKDVTRASDILNQLRAYIISTMRQSVDADAGSVYSATPGHMKDGMDISLTVINLITGRCQWAGANNPLYIIRNAAISQETSAHLACQQVGGQWPKANSNLEEVKVDLTPGTATLVEVKGDSSPGTATLVEVKGDKMPIAVHVRMNEFTNHELQLNKGDRIYLFSDGYADQFGGPKGKKILYSEFKRIITDTSHLDIEAQGKAMENILDEWMQYDEVKYKQVDDIAILGMEI